VSEDVSPFAITFIKLALQTQLFQEFNKLKGDDTALTGLSLGVLNCLLIAALATIIRFRHTASVITIRI